MGRPPNAGRDMDYQSVSWLWIVALCPCPGNLDHPSQIQQMPARPEGFANSSLPGNTTDSTGATGKGTDPLSRSWGAVTTPASPLLQSSPEHKMDAPAPRKGSAAAFWAPPLVAVVLLVGLFLMYRRKRGRESRSRAASINASSESDSEDDPAVGRDARLNLPPEIPEEALQTTEMLCAAMDGEAGGPQARPPI